MQMNLLRELWRRHKANQALTTIHNPGEPMDKWYALGFTVLLVLVGLAIIGLQLLNR